MNTIKESSKKIVKALFYPDDILSLIPNWLSFSRAIGGVALPIMVYTNASLPIILGSSFYLAISDYLDGKAARLLVKKETNEGALLDAVSDKIFSISLIIGILPVLPIFALNGASELTIAYINNKNLSQGGNPKSNILGKVKIWPLSIALGLAYLGISTKTEKLLVASKILSISTVPLEIINIKQYNDEYKKQTKENTIEKNEIKKNKLSLSKSKHKYMVYNIPAKVDEKQIQNQELKKKQYVKKYK